MLVHRALGPGLLESIYDECLNRGLVAAGFRGREAVIVEVKSVVSIQPVHVAQRPYLHEAFQLVSWLTINFNVAVLARGVKRLILTPDPSGKAM